MTWATCRSLLLATTLLAAGCPTAPGPGDTGEDTGNGDTGPVESICPPASGVTGGYFDVAVDAPDVVAAATFAVEEIVGKPVPPFEILCAQRQVVAGRNYRMGLDIEGARYLVVVFQDLAGAYRLTSAAPVD